MTFTHDEVAHQLSHAARCEAIARADCASAEERRRWNIRAERALAIAVALDSGDERAAGEAYAIRVPGAIF